MTERKAKSPYQRHRKAPFQYSEPYQAWRAAVLRGDKRMIEHNADRHNRLFGLRTKYEV